MPAAADIAPATAVRRAAKLIAARAVVSHSAGETPAEVERDESAEPTAAVEKATPRRISPRRNFSHARARRLRTVPAGQPRRRAVSSTVRPSK